VELRYWFGLSLIAWTLFIIFVNLGLILVPNIKTAIRNGRMKWRKRRNEKLKACKAVQAAISVSRAGECQAATIRAKRRGDTGLPLQLKTRLKHASVEEISNYEMKEKKADAE